MLCYCLSNRDSGPCLLCTLYLHREPWTPKNCGNHQESQSNRQRKHHCWRACLHLGFDYPSHPPSISSEYRPELLAGRIWRQGGGQKKLETVQNLALSASHNESTAFLGWSLGHSDTLSPLVLSLSKQNFSRRVHDAHADFGRSLHSRGLTLSMATAT